MGDRGRKPGSQWSGTSGWGGGTQELEGKVSGIRGSLDPCCPAPQKLKVQDLDSELHVKVFLII